MLRTLDNKRALPPWQSLPSLHAVLDRRENTVTQTISTMNIELDKTELEIVAGALYELTERARKQVYPTRKLHKQAWKIIKQIEDLRSRILKVTNLYVCVTSNRPPPWRQVEDPSRH